MAVGWIKLSGVTVCLFIALSQIVQAQIVTDGTLGKAATLSGPNFQISSEFGKLVGPNLFHSFSEFSLQKGEAAVFTGPENIGNILGRVTGGKTSNIDGLIQSEIAGANLYLLNPSGFLFGKNAEINVDGAFSVHASEKLNLEGEGVFDALNPDQSVFFSSSPESFGFLEGNPVGEIKLDATKLKIEGASRSFQTVGRKIEGTNSSSITLNKGATLQQHAIEIHHNKTKIKTLSVKGDEAGAGGVEMVADEIRLIRPNITSDTREGDAGDLVIKSNNTFLLAGKIYAISKGSGKTAGVIFTKNKLDENSLFEVQGGGVINSDAKSTGSGSDISIEHDEMQLEAMTIKSLTRGEGNGARILANGKKLISKGRITSTVASKSEGGKGGDIFIEVDDVTIKYGRIFSENLTLEDESSKGGDIRVKGKVLTLLTAGSIYSETSGYSNAGDISIESEYINLQGKNSSTPIWFWQNGGQEFGGIGSVTHKRGGNIKGGNTGDLKITADHIKLSRGGVIFVVTKGSGDAGTLDLNAKKLEITGSENFYRTGGDVWNNVGDIDNEMYDSQITGQVWDNLATGEWDLSSGKGGDLNITVDELYMNKKGRIRLESWGAGSAGTLQLRARKIRMSKISTIDAYAATTGNSGSVFIFTDDIELDQSGITAFTKGTGMPGKISIRPFSKKENSRLILMNSSGLSTSLNSGNGIGGDLSIDIEEFQIINSKIKSDAGKGALGSAGNININVNTFRIKGTSPHVNTEISATTKGKADGGVIRIHSDRIDFSRVNINSESTDKRLSVIGGDSGVIEIKSKDLTFGEGVSVSTATLGLGKAGLIDIQSDTIKMEGGDSHLKGVSITGNTRLRDESGKIGDLVGGIGGSINLRGKSIHLGGNVMISSETWGNGSAGELKIESGELELTDGAQVSVNSGFALDSKYAGKNAFVTGSGGELHIDTERLSLANGASLSAASTAFGQGGAIKLKADKIEVDSGSSIESHAYAAGDAGSIQLQATSLQLTGGFMRSGAEQEGRAGSIDLDLTESLMLGQAASISVNSAKADGGDILINTDGTVRLAKSKLTAAAAKDGGSVRMLGSGNMMLIDSRMSAEAGQDGGNIEVRSPRSLVLQRSDLSANAIHGNGGYISIAADGYLPSRESLVSASSEFGLEGSVEIDTPETDVGSGFVILPDGLMSMDANIAERCALRLSGDVSSFFLNGYGGIPAASSENYLPAFLTDDEEE